MNQRTVPNGPLLAVGALLGIAVLGVTAARLSGPLPVPAPLTAIASRDLRFADLPNGSILVSDADAHRTVAVLPPGTDDFVRMTMRGMARTRRLRAVKGDVPFRLAASAEGRLTIKDPTTNSVIELEAFGPSNAGAFAHLLAARETPAETVRGKGP